MFLNNRAFGLTEIPHEHLNSNSNIQSKVTNQSTIQITPNPTIISPICNEKPFIQTKSIDYQSLSKEQLRQLVCLKK